MLSMLMVRTVRDKTNEGDEAMSFTPRLNT